MTARPREFLSRLPVRRHLTDHEVAAFVPRRLRPAPPVGLHSGTGIDLDLPEPAPARPVATEITCDAPQLAALLELLEDPRAYDVQMRAGRYTVTYTPA